MKLANSRLILTLAMIGFLVSISSKTNAQYNYGYYSYEDYYNKRESVKVLELHDVDFSILPESIADFPALTMLYLSGNRLKELPESIGKCKNLEVLAVSVSGLESLPESIGDLHKLRELTIYSNSIFKLPESIGNLRNLEVLSVSNNNLQTLPKSIYKLENLSELSIFGNSISKSEIKKLKRNLKDCYIEDVGGGYN